MNGLNRTGLNPARIGPNVSGWGGMRRLGCVATRVALKRVAEVKRTVEGGSTMLFVLWFYYK